MSDKICTRCGNLYVAIKNGTKDGIQRYKCQACASEAIPKPRNGNILIIGDVHLPFEHRGYLEFVKSIQAKYEIEDGNIYCAGDFLDHHAMSFHQHNANGMSPEDEYQLAQEKCEEWYEAFPVMKIANGNHDALPARQALSAGLPNRYMRSLHEVMGMPNEWEYKDEFWLNENTKLFHGTGYGGMYPHSTAARSNMVNVVMGHTHSVAGVHWIVNERHKLFGMAVGCGVDRDTYAMAYAANNPRKPVLSCGVLLGGTTPLIEMMDLGE